MNVNSLSKRKRNNRVRRPRHFWGQSTGNSPTMSSPMTRRLAVKLTVTAAKGGRGFIKITSLGRNVRPPGHSSSHRSWGNRYPTPRNPPPKLHRRQRRQRQFNRHRYFHSVCTIHRDRPLLTVPGFSMQARVNTPQPPTPLPEEEKRLRGTPAAAPPPPLEQPETCHTLNPLLTPSLQPKALILLKS